MKLQRIAKTIGGQDGAVWGGYLFRFDTEGGCHVFETEKLKTEECVDEISFFQLDRSDILKPHSNAVMFGGEYFEQGDEFPLLYTNIYNSYSSCEDKKEGVCAVYRIERDGKSFSSTLAQVIKIGFTDNYDYWRSCDSDVRPYGNFVLDRENGVYYGFTMRDKPHTSRYFSFELPKLSDGNPDAEYGVNTVTLGIDSIKDMFDCEYHNYIQGACFHDGKIYSLEGFESEDIRPALRIIDTKNKCMEKYIDLWGMGYRLEPEFIDFHNGECWYGDGHGNLFLLDFTE
ncbi:MAG: hypothetical protein IKV97_03920 [Clostridia bacterium]|nr:hypothetical protein [Clostridia bacterium]